MTQLEDAIAQATWLEEQTGLTVDDLWTTDPNQFDVLAREWREEHPLNQLGG